MSLTSLAAQGTVFGIVHNVVHRTHIHPGLKLTAHVPFCGYPYFSLVYEYSGIRSLLGDSGGNA